MPETQSRQVVISPHYPETGKGPEPVANILYPSAGRETTCSAATALDAPSILTTFMVSLRYSSILAITGLTLYTPLQRQIPLSQLVRF